MSLINKKQKHMKKLIFVILLTGIVFSCGTKSAKIGNIDEEDVSYYEDTRTGLCFSAVGSRQGSDISGAGTGMGWTCVPCDSLSSVKVIKLR